MEKISILMGIYNCEDTLPESIQSVIDQTYENWELILCDDASTDNTYAVAESFREKYPDKIKIIRHEKNQYLAASLNDCLKAAEGELVARMDGDDLCTPDRFEKQVKYLHEHPEMSMVGTAMQWFNENGPLKVLTMKPEPTKTDLRNGSPFCHATIMARKEVFDALGGYTVSERTRRGQDYDLWFRFYAAGYKGGNMDEALYLCREDMKALKRRTFKVRLNDCKTQFIGYKLLGYPLHWYIIPLLKLLKGFVPVKLIMKYREFQSRSSK